MASSPDLSLILPCYNEAGILEATVREILETLDAADLRCEIIFVDDASLDGTARVIEGILRSRPGRSMRARIHEANAGRGACVAEGIRSARGEWVGFIDVDLETHCRHIPAAIARLRNGADVAVAHRLPRVGVRDLHRHVLSRGYNLLVRLLLRLPFQDTEAGFKFFRRRKVLPLLDRIESNGWFWDTEVMAIAHRAGLRIVEVPCPFVRRPDHPSTVRPLRDSLEYFVRLLAFRRRLRGREAPLGESVPAAERRRSP